MGLTYVEFELLLQLQVYGAATPRELFRKLGQLAEPLVTDAVDAFVEQGVLEKQGTCIAVTRQAQALLEPYRVQRAVILAAGMGRRLLPATQELPKPMVKVEGRRLVESQLDALLAAGITDITVVRGHHGHVFDQLLETYPAVKLVDSPDFATTNNIVSTHLVADRLEGAYIIEGDLLLRNQRVIRPYEYQSYYCGISVQNCDDWCFTVDNGTIQSVSYGSEQPCYQYVGISFWSPVYARRLGRDIAEALSHKGNDQLFLEAVPLKLYRHHYSLSIRPLTNNDVIEIDHYRDLQSVDSSYQKEDYPQTTEHSAEES